MSNHSSVFQGINKKSVFAALMAVVLVCGLAIPVSSASATPADSKQAEADAALAKLSQYQSQLDAAEANYESALQEQTDAEAKVEEAETQIAEKTEVIEKNQSQLSDRARSMYRSGSTSFVDVILGASSFEEFATSWNLLEKLNSEDAELISETKEARETLEAAKKEAEEQAKVAAEKAAECQSVAESAQASVDEMQSVYDSLSAEAADLVAQQQAAEEAEAQQQAIAGIEAAQNNNTSNNTSNNNSSNNNSNNNKKNNNASNTSTNDNKSQTVSGNTVVSRAYSCLGKPYVWGAVGPNGYDCSGLVSYCITGQHKRLGTTGTFAGYTRVSNPQPGDICLNSHHAGIYIGNGQMIHAPSKGDVVKVSSVHKDMWYVRY